MVVLSQDVIFVSTLYKLLRWSTSLSDRIWLHSQDLVANLVSSYEEMRNSRSCMSQFIFGVSRVTTHESSSQCHECETKLCSLWMLLVLFPSSTHYRLAHRNDCLDKKLYPLLTHKHRVATQKCAVCHVFIGRCVKMSDLACSEVWIQAYIPDSFQMVYYQWPICSEWPMSLLWQVLPDAALRCSRQQAGRFPGLPLCGPRCI